MSKLVLPLAIVAAAGSAVIAFTQFHAASKLKAQIAHISAELAAERDALKKLQLEKQAADDSLALLKENNERLKRERDEMRDKNKQFLADIAAGKRHSSDAPGSQKPLDLRGMFQGFAKKMDDPEMRKLMKQSQERQITAAYEALFQKLGLTDEETKLVAELLADRNFAALDQGRKILSGNGADEATSAAIRGEIEASKSEYDSKLKSVLGEQKFTELAAFEQTVGDQRALDGFDRTFRSKSQALTAGQKSGLVDIMREERMKSPTNEIPDLSDGPGMAVLMNDAELKAREERDAAWQQRVVSRASAAGLSPDQVNILQDSFKQRSDRRASSARMGRAFIRPQ